MGFTFLTSDVLLYFQTGWQIFSALEVRISFLALTATDEHGQRRVGRWRKRGWRKGTTATKALSPPELFSRQPRPFRHRLKLCPCNFWMAYPGADAAVRAGDDIFPTDPFGKIY